MTIQAKSGASRSRNAAQVRGPSIALAIAGGGPLGAMYEIGALLALDEALDGMDFNRDVDIYVGVSAGSLITAALANHISPSEIYRMFIENEAVDGERLKPEVFFEACIRGVFSSGPHCPWLAGSGVMALCQTPAVTQPY